MTNVEVNAVYVFLLVVGTRGLSGIVGLRLGRVPLQLVRHSQLPVVLVPPEADEKEPLEPVHGEEPCL